MHHDLRMVSVASKDDSESAADTASDRTKIVGLYGDRRVFGVYPLFDFSFPVSFMVRCLFWVFTDFLLFSCIFYAALCTNVSLLPLPPPLRGPPAFIGLAEPMRVANSRVDRATSPVP